MPTDFSSHLRHHLAPRLRGQLYTDLFSRGRYATDASMYQMMPKGVVIPKDIDDVRAVIDFSKSHGVPILPRGGGTSQCGQTVNEALVVDNSRYLNQVVALDVENRRCVVEPGMVLDELNRMLAPHGLWFPVDVSTASRATIGGMTANNSCGSRSIRYGLMRDNVRSVETVMADGEVACFGVMPREAPSQRQRSLVQSLLDIGRREHEEVARCFPKVMRRVGGYNIDALVPANSPVNLSHLLVGSEGTLGYFKAIELKLAVLPRHRLLGVCHFPSFHDAMESAQHLVRLDPVAVELIDRTMIDLSRNIPMYRDIVDQFVRGEPEAILLVEFAEENADENRRRLQALGEVMADLGFAFDHSPAKRGGVVEAIDSAFQKAIFEVRKSGLNIMMSMRDDRKPVSFVEDCAVELKDLAQYTARLTEIFHKHGTQGTWYAHASVGCLHVRPVLNLRLEKDRKAMRAIAEECFEMVREYQGSHSGEHGDGLCRSEFHEKMYGSRMIRNFREIKQLFDPENRLNPGKIVDAPKMDDPTLFRYPPGYVVPEMKMALNWDGWTGAGGGFQGAVEMCNNNGACRKLSGGSMCPSYRVTRDEKHLTRGRANTLRLAISGQLGKDALTSAEMVDTMRLCVSCKACKRECPTGVDMARMKIEVNAARLKSQGTSFHDRLIAELPLYAPLISKMPWLFNVRNQARWIRSLTEPVTGICKDRMLPIWRTDIYRPLPETGPVDGRPVILFADTFNTYFEPDNLRAAAKVLTSLGYRVISPMTHGRRPVCCGRTYLTTGMVDKASREVTRLLAVFEPYLDSKVPVIGLEPSCLLSMRDELPGLMNSPLAGKLAKNSYLLEEFLSKEQPDVRFNPIDRKVLLHGHCHQKAYNLMSDVERVLQMVPGLDISTIESSCCGMAGAFGYASETADISRKMAELDLLPEIRNASDDTLLIADGMSCRHQIALGVQREVSHVVQVLEMALPE